MVIGSLRLSCFQFTEVQSFPFITNDKVGKLKLFFCTSFWETLRFSQWKKKLWVLLSSKRKLKKSYFQNSCFQLKSFKVNSGWKGEASFGSYENKDPREQNMIKNSNYREKSSLLIVSENENAEEGRCKLLSATKGCLSTPPISWQY